MIDAHAVNAFLAGVLLIGAFMYAQRGKSGVTLAFAVLCVLNLSVAVRGLT